MEYTQKTVLEAIWEITPSYKKAYDNNIFLGVPSLVRDCLLTYFVTKNDQPEQSDAYNHAGSVLLAAFKDLHEEGHFKYKDTL
jgi:hypothetical protein